jgi:hypothetical protein
MEEDFCYQNGWRKGDPDTIYAARKTAPTVAG